MEKEAPKNTITIDYLDGNCPDGTSYSEAFARTNKKNPKPEDKALLRKAYDADPALAHRTGNLQRLIFQMVVDRASSDSFALRESINRYIAHMKAELGYETSSFAERLLIDEVCLRWLRLQSMENAHEHTTSGSHSLAVGLYMDRRLHLAHQRYMRAIETLAKVRKLIVGTQTKAVEMYRHLSEAAHLNAEDFERIDS
jgi:hypothetical protein